MNETVAFIKRTKGFNDRQLAEFLGMNRNTMYSRLKTGKWKESEKLLINTKYLLLCE